MREKQYFTTSSLARAKSARIGELTPLKLAWAKLARLGEISSPGRATCSPIFLLHGKDHILSSKYYFEDPNGKNLYIGVRNLLLKFQDDPTVNESGMWILPTQVLE